MTGSARGARDKGKRHNDKRSLRVFAKRIRPKVKKRKRAPTQGPKGHET